MKYLLPVAHFFWIIAGIVLIGALPGLLNGFSLDLISYLNEVKSIVLHLIQPNELTYKHYASETERDLFPALFQPYFYSLTIFFGAFLVAAVVALLLACTIIFLRNKKIRMVKYLVFIVESLPDIVVIFSAQILVVWIHQNMGIQLFNFVTLGGEYAYFLPIVTLAILPCVYLFKVTLLSLETELDEDYVDMARAKGVGNVVVIFKHILRNALTGIVIHIGPVLWLMLANMVMLEYLFNMYGITQFIFANYSAEIFTLGLIMLFIPIFIVQLLIKYIAGKFTGEAGELYV
ncbi:ABC transporter permease subunit [Virgibacillus kekensis]|uniref:ABC transporter permease subunit n=1 Tax=Virgibacillus kekensis TaxID=202261 RepID=A0ABV9DK60_9BACI